MTAEERSWQIANALCARALSDGIVHMVTMTTILTEALQAAEAEAYQRGVANEREALLAQCDRLEKCWLAGGSIQASAAVAALAIVIRERETS